MDKGYVSRLDAGEIADLRTIIAAKKTLLVRGAAELVGRSDILLPI